MTLQISHCLINYTCVCSRIGRNNIIPTKSLKVASRTTSKEKDIFESWYYCCWLFCQCIFLDSTKYIERIFFYGYEWPLAQGPTQSKLIEPQSKQITVAGLSLGNLAE